MSILTAKDLHWFRLANSAPSPDFYAFKDRFLKRFAEPAGYELQKIDRACWTCDGSGVYSETEPCFKCGGSGIYRTDDVWLKRFILAGSVYHKPVNSAEVWQENDYRYPEPHNVIEGRIKHADVSDKVARRAFYRLLLRHEPVVFWQFIANEIKAKSITARKGKFYFCLIRLRNKLDLFPAVPEDDVPF